MFNVTVTQAQYNTLRKKLSVRVSKEYTWHEYGVKYIDAVIGEPEQGYSKKIAKQVARLLA